MGILVTTLHIIVCLFLVVVVLLQSGKAADLAGAFGGMGSQTVFGPRGSATVLTRATTGAAIAFMITSLTLSVMSTGNFGGTPSILEENVAPVEEVTPATGDAGANGEQAIPLPFEAPAEPAGEDAAPAPESQPV